MCGWLNRNQLARHIEIPYGLQNLSTEHFQNLLAELGMWDVLKHFQLCVLSVAFYIYMQFNFSLASIV